MMPNNRNCGDGHMQGSVARQDCGR